MLLAELGLVAGLVVVHSLVQCLELPRQFGNMIILLVLVELELTRFHDKPHCLFLRLPEHFLDFAHVLLNLLCLLFLVHLDLLNLDILLMNLLDEYINFISL